MLQTVGCTGVTNLILSISILNSCLVFGNLIHFSKDTLNGRGETLREKLTIQRDIEISKRKTAKDSNFIMHLIKKAPFL